MAVNLNFNFILHIEILQKVNSLLSKKAVISAVANYLNTDEFLGDVSHVATNFRDPIIGENIEKITCERQNHFTKNENGNKPQVHYYVYSFNSVAPELQDVDDEQSVSTQWLLPTEDFSGLWESLVYDSNVKTKLLKYVETSLKFSEKEVNPNIIACNRVVLLHGPPGTGKTSLCKALAQKVAIRLSSKFKYGVLVEVNTHSLFSKWFSESGKMVTKLFHSILSILEDDQVLVLVLLDEVESLARSRASALGGNEPSDALRVVNALLTHLDMIKRHPNVLILTTSNITEAIDVALIDRADIKQFIGLPSLEAIYEILLSCIKELIRANIIVSPSHHFKPFIEVMDCDSQTCGEVSQAGGLCQQIKMISKQCVGLSGRTLRKMPFLACSRSFMTELITMEEFLRSLTQTVQEQWQDIRNLSAHV